MSRRKLGLGFGILGIALLGAGWLLGRPPARPAPPPHPGWAHYGGDAASTRSYPFPVRGAEARHVLGFSVGLRAAPGRWGWSIADRLLLVGRAGQGRLQIIGLDPRGQTLTARDEQGRTRWRCALPYLAWPHCLADLDGDGTDEILLGVDRVKQEKVLVVDAPGRVVRELLGEPTMPQSDGSRVEIETFPWAVLAVGPQRRPQVVAGCRGITGLYRSVVLFDVPTGRRVWSYEVSLDPWFDQAACADLNGDGPPEILVGGYAPAHGRAVNGTEDRHSYVVALSSAGRCVWNSPALGGAFTWTFPAVRDLDGDGRPEVVVILRANYGERTDTGRVVLLDPATGTVRRACDLGSSVRGVALGDVVGSPAAEIVVGARDGVLRVLDGSLRLVETFDCGAPVTVGALNDLGGDGKQEIVAMTLRNEVLVADAYGETPRKISRYPLAPPGSPPHAGGMGGAGVPHYLWETDRRAPPGSPPHAGGRGGRACRTTSGRPTGASCAWWTWIRTAPGKSWP